MKIGRLAIDEKYSGKGLGTHILNDILKNLKDISENNIDFDLLLLKDMQKHLILCIEKWFEF